jgi:hypothetical protein
VSVEYLADGVMCSLFGDTSAQGVAGAWVTARQTTDDGVPAPEEADTPAEPVSSECDAAMAAAAAFDPMADTVTDLDPAVRACATLSDWTLAASRHPDALDRADPATFAQNRYFEASLATAALCQDLG